MQINLARDSDMPLRQQLAEQIVFLITTGQLREGEELPSVRTLARLVKVHHNTVSEAYQELVGRGWLAGRHGSRLTVGAATSPVDTKMGLNLDQLINESIQRATEMGYSLQALRERVSERLLAQPPDHVLVVEQEDGLRAIIRCEVLAGLAWPVEDCSWQEFIAEPGLAIGAQVLAPNHILGDIRQFITQDRPCVSIAFSTADEHIRRIRDLKNPSLVAVASVSKSLLKTARSLFASAIGRKHTFQEFLLAASEPIELRGMDVVFCDTLAMPLVSCRNKIRYELLASGCLDHLAAALGLNPSKR